MAKGKSLGMHQQSFIQTFHPGHAMELERHAMSAAGLKAGPGWGNEADDHALMDEQPA